MMYNVNKFRDFCNKLDEDNLLLFFFNNILNLKIKDNNYVYRITNNGIDIFYKRTYNRYIFGNSNTDKSLVVEDYGDYYIYNLDIEKCNGDVLKGDYGSNLIIFASLFFDINNYKLLNKKISGYITTYL